MKALLAPLLVIPLAILSSPASAGLLGQHVTVDARWSDIDTVDEILGSGTVSAGGYTATLANLGITVSDTQITIQPLSDPGLAFYPSTGFSGVGITQTGAFPSMITGFSVNPLTHVYDSAYNYTFDPARVSFDAAHLFINLQDLHILTNADPWPDDRIVLDLQFASTAVPEPATWAMMILGFGAIGLTLRRRHAGLPAMRLA